MNRHPDAVSFPANETGPKTTTGIIPRGLGPFEPGNNFGTGRGGSKPKPTNNSFKSEYYVTTVLPFL